ncbi:MAG: hypothetical protein F7C38_03765 [Desulfurococcales archaeon]|nr:hypothetical protein [Desulfurococcales archaeon]
MARASHSSVEDDIIALLRETGIARKTAKGNEWPQCRELTGITRDDQPFFLYIYQGRYSGRTIIRITPTPQDCIHALYTPNALYVVHIGNEEELKKSLEIKIKTITRIHGQSKQ